jgi:gas vesicle protein
VIGWWTFLFGIGLGGLIGFVAGLDIDRRRP